MERALPAAGSAPRGGPAGLGRVAKALQLCCLCYSLVAAALASDNSGDGGGGSSALDDDYIFVTPVQVDSGGAYITHDILHSSSRKKRSANSSLHYRFSAFGQEIHLDLKPSAILSHHFMVQVLGKDGASETLDPNPEVQQCFYQGFVRNDSFSSVAVSTCAGLSGLIKTQKNAFLISPLPQLLALKHNYSSPTGNHPHVLYKRTAEAKVQQYQGYPGSSQNDPGSPSTHTFSASRHQEQEPHPPRFQKQHFCGRRKKYAPKSPTQDTYLMFDEYGTLRRPRRASGENQKGLNVETLVVADKKMVEKHGKENVTTYILTVMNMVSSLFKDGTIGSDINIIVVSLILLEQDPVGLLINHHADQSLNSFCQWQSALIGKNGKRHDHAILLTGLDICSWKDEPCDTLGFAPISGMCSKYRSCTINEDTGLGLAFTIAHESGHNFGMVHDGEGNPCGKVEGSIMSPTLMGNNGLFSWSSCSRQDLQKFLSTPQAGCLVDEPKQTGQYKYPDKLPGQIYDADTQCKWQFGAKAKLCTFDFVKDICKSLWCHRMGHRCETKYMPAAEGTECGLSKWCRQGQCVQFGEHGPQPVDGQWSTWSSWSECSRTCGGGVKYQERDCNNPKPRYGGKFCPGSSRNYQLCNTHPCNKSSLDFRAQQCAEHNSKPFRGWFYKWEPYTKVQEEDQCKLYCKAENFDFFFAMSGKVKDGTPCSPNKHDVCIDGICKPVGCDHKLGSKAVLDSCGICKGDNSTCKIYKGLYLNQHKKNGYYPVVIIPAGAQGIEIQELQISTSYLAVRNLSQKYYLMGDWSISWPGEFPFAGTTFQYQRTFHRPEHLHAPGPTNETLVFECSKTCGRGVRKREVLCKSSDTGGNVSESLCSSTLKPASQEGCVLGRCPKNNRLQWVVSSWSECSVTCGSGIRRRELQCSEDLQGKLITFPERRCRNIKKPNPDLEETCNQGLCPTHPVYSTPARWYASPWQQCTVTCGGGVQTRTVYCLQQGRPSLYCRLEEKPPVLQACNTNFCLALEKREDPSCVDFFSWCYLAPQHGVCNHKFYGKQCCKSCTRKS
ncbi:A disintegrin and metalloproteinase with thrombospondin motifs 18 isoform X4 [Erinaceus europaeus]|uniref:A disintegrin and metalloproteinase with thrombospondin motifs 18 isoform X4 n=1 Tax=Erinaceus europaeus TaxID=9365 RepID=A0ABM3WX10_ERIEU|nr:A disintegrin and metalloproteinase with thrombospondin motifs 18 isoform X4 [Erinaceus europaeus]